MTEMTVALPCPNPTKIKYPSRKAAYRYIHTSSDRDLLSVYPCNCGAWHVTSSTTKVPEKFNFMRVTLEYLDGDEKLLQDATEEQFHDVVRRDVHGETTRPEARSLRHPAHRARWMHELQTLFLSVEADMIKQKGDMSPDIQKWRRSAHEMQRAIRARRHEAKQRSRQEQQLKEQANQQRRPARKALKDVVTTRLIDNHPEEFAYLYHLEYLRRKNSEEMRSA